MPANHCPVCRRPISPLRSFFRPAWSRWTCPGCDSLIGMSIRRRVLASVVWIPVIVLWLFALRRLRWPMPLGLPLLVVVGLALYVLLDGIVVHERRGLRCRACGYDLRGQVEPACPECGAALDEADARALHAADPASAVAVAGGSGRWRSWATFAVLFVLAAVLLVQGLFVFGRTRRARADSTRTVLSAITDYAAAHDGALPAHAVGLTAGPAHNAWMFIDWDTDTLPATVRLGGLSVRGFESADEGRQAEITAELAQAIPDDVVAHRVGDFVFTYHGIDLDTTDPDLWLTVLVPDPARNPLPGPDDRVPVGLTDGSVVAIPVPEFPGALLAQNARRAERGLAPLPDPAGVSAGAPATGR